MIESLRARPQSRTASIEFSRTSTEWLFAVAVAAITMAVHFFRFGYAYASGDQDETLSLVLQRLDPTLYGGDWFIQTQAGEMGVRTAFVWLLSLMAELVPLWIAVLLVHVATFVLLALAVCRLSTALTSNRTVALLTVFVSLVLTPQWTLGSNDLVHSILAPSTVAWCLALWGVVLHLEERRFLAGLLLGLATLFQALVGLQVAVVVLSHLLVMGHPSFRARVRAVAITGLPFALLSAVLLIPLLLERMSAAPPPEDDVFPSLFYILAGFRAPHHYLPLSFSTGSYVRFGFLVLAGMAGLLWLRRRDRLRNGDFLFVGLNVLAVFLVLGFLFTETLPVLLAASFQPFKITVLAKPIFVTGILGALLIDTRIGNLALQIQERAAAIPSSTLLMAAGVVVAVLVTGGILIRDGAHSMNHAASDLGRVERWAASSTDVRATFLVPPSNTTFRANARRGIVINFKSIPFEPDLGRMWFQRLLAIAPIELPPRSTPETLRELDEQYTHQAPHRLSALAAQFGASYILVERDVNAPETLREVFSSGPWHVYQAVSAAGPHLTVGPERSRG